MHRPDAAGVASVALAQQAGAIDSHFLRRLLADHAEANFELLPAGAEPTGSFLAELAADEMPGAGVVFIRSTAGGGSGSPCH